jgi:hypothetical protein
MTNQPATEALLAYIRDVAGCTTGWSTYRPDRIAWSLTTRQYHCVTNYQNSIFILNSLDYFF